ncbi:lipoyl(octanoyl) transferase LipB [Desulfonatronovibrio hydrogenovorans]|uniref:lipoyl(octanoyl) transferase LipB n=1 Tax=Desulfonatronovibrio hydrogenovorans TaxID=53245 RepID=UPI00048CDC46|nr:lipoyl(octanoyl) transferase LipB [Desulfonatronovibrio hydrogenovorans]
MIFIDLGLMDYNEAFQIQLEALKEVVDGGAERVFLLEHYPVITLGRNRTAANLLVTEKELQARGVDLVKTSRGGDITCHFPGQLVIYPILRIEKQPGGLKQFFLNLESAVITTLACYGIKAVRKEGRSGVFVQDRKIASTGIGVKKWTTYHGLALNIFRDLELFELINPCGVSGGKTTSVHLELDSCHPDMATVKNDAASAMKNIFMK